jgi:hypothetical protein
LKRGFSATEIVRCHGNILTEQGVLNKNYSVYGAKKKEV